MKKLNHYLSAILLFGLMLSANLCSAQCKGWVKRKCLPSVTESGFKFSGQMNTAVLVEGEKADMSLSFNSGQTYRLMVCSEAILGDVSFKIMDAERTLIYDSSGDEANFFDFNVESTQQLIIEIVIPAGESTHGMSHHGCVSIIQGYK
jgi:hypothetical protein